MSTTIKSSNHLLTTPTPYSTTQLNARGISTIRQTFPTSTVSTAYSTTFFYVTETSTTALAALSILIAAFGLLFNTLSLSYFINTIVSNRGSTKNDASTTSLFTALNIFDLMVSLTSSFEFLLYLFGNDSLTSYKVLKTVCSVSVFLTGCITCLLGAVRIIHLLFPLREINRTAVKLSIAVYTAFVIVLEVLIWQQKLTNGETRAYYFLLDIEFLVLVSVFLTVVFVNVISLLKLYLTQPSGRETWKRKATITVAILSAIYCVCNIGFIVVFASETKTFSVWSFSSIPRELVHVSYFILLPLNSACNPVVYLIRREEMRSYVINLWRRLSDCLRKRENNTTTLESQV